MSTTVRNRMTGDGWQVVYTLPPREAVRSAYAQFGRGDYNTWDYAKYDHLVVDSLFTVSCGTFFAWKEGFPKKGGE